jgi:nucleoside-diphosphate-sugar epimerase
MRELDISRGVYTSTLAIFSDTKGQVVDENYYFDPEQADGFISEYDRTKWLAHYEVALPMIKEGLPLTIVMPGVVYGPGDTSAVGEALVQYLTGKLPVAPKQTAYTWAHVEDIARAHILAMESGQAGESYIIAGDVRTFIEAFELAEEVSGVPAPRLRPGPGVMKFMAGMAGVLNNVFPLPPNMHPESLRAIAGVTYLGDNAKARRELGYAPRPFEEGWPETVRHEMQLLGIEAPQK